MNEAARDANENMHRREVLSLLRSIDASLKLLVERTAPPVQITINDLPPEQAESLSRGLADLNAGRVSDFVVRSR